VVGTLGLVLAAKRRGLIPSARAVVEALIDSGMYLSDDAGRLPFDDGTFDVVTSTEAFHWFPDRDAVLREAYRVLTPGGRLLLALVSPPARVVSDAFYVGSRLIGEPFYWPLRRALMKVRPEYFGWSPAERERYEKLLTEWDRHGKGSVDLIDVSEPPEKNIHFVFSFARIGAALTLNG